MKPRKRTAEEQLELDELIAQQASEDRSWVSGSRYAISLDALLGSEEGETTLKDLIVEIPDFTPFGYMRRLIEQNGENTKWRARVRRRLVGWRLTQKEKAA